LDREDTLWEERRKEVTDERLKLAGDMAEKLLTLLQIEGTVTAAEDKTNEAINVQIETADPGILIGFHGEALSSFQLILNIIVGKKLGEWTRILVNVGDYRQKREETLRRIGLNAAQKARFSGEAVVLSDLSAADRRIIHLALAEYDDITTESEGEGKDRKLVVKPRKTG